MSKITLILIVLSLFGQMNCQCGDGTYQSASGGSDPDKGKCTTCNPLCKTCTSSTACTSYIEIVKGVEGSTVKCTGVTLGGAYGYNSKKDTCDRCNEGCLLCGIDYDICV